MLKYVLLPGLCYAPKAFQKTYLAERAPRIRDILSRTPATAPHLM